jgi:hypothetical protein
MVRVIILILKDFESRPLSQRRFQYDAGVGFRPTSIRKKL